MQPISFAQWKEENKEYLESLEADMQIAKYCDHCNGEGEHECNCGDIHDCHFCDGTGKEYGFDSIEKKARDIYESYLYADKKKLERWTQGIPIKG